MTDHLTVEQAAAVSVLAAARRRRKSADDAAVQAAIHAEAAHEAVSMAISRCLKLDVPSDRIA